MSIDHCDTHSAAAPVPGEGNAARRVANGFGHFRPPALPHAAGQKTHRDGDGGEHRHHQDGSGEHLDQL
jgi:hypothetical protein